MRLPTFALLLVSALATLSIADPSRAAADGGDASSDAGVAVDGAVSMDAARPVGMGGKPGFSGGGIDCAAGGAAGRPGAPMLLVLLATLWLVRRRVSCRT